MPFVLRIGPSQNSQLAAVGNLLPTPITNVSATSTVAGQINLTWTGGVGNNVKYTYSVYNNTGSVLVSPSAYTVSGANPTTITFTDTISKSYTVTVTATVLGGNSSGTSNTIATLVSNPFTINSTISGWSTVNDISGTSITSGTSYKVYVFKPALAAGAVSATYTLSYTSTAAKNIYILAVGGGASGGGYWGGGGGAGGVVMATVPIPITSTSSNITVTVGSGGNVNASVPYSTKGLDTSVTFNNLSTYNIIANGGGIAGQMGNTGNAGGDGGCGGGGGGYQPTVYGNSNQQTYSFATVYGKRGGSSVSTQGGGGGGANTIGGDGGGAGTRGGAGGNGIQCSLPGIGDFSSGTYKNYYWGGGGGGCGWGNSIGGGNGGLGGGGGGGAESAYGSLGGTGGITNGTDGQGGTAIGGGDAGANTGGGGGGEWNQGPSGKGGSGIVIIAFPT